MHLSNRQESENNSATIVDLPKPLSLHQSTDWTEPMSSAPTNSLSHFQTLQSWTKRRVRKACRTPRGEMGEGNTHAVPALIELAAAGVALVHKLSEVL